jgi:putative ABC transport system permease protein
MVVLRKKTLREIKENKGVYIACIVVIIIGLLAYTAMSIVMENLERAQGNFYQETHFADGFIKLTGYPENKVEALANLPGIDAVEGRIVKDVRLFEEQSDANRSLRMVSINRSNPPDLNQIQLFSGRLPEDHKPELLVDPKFFAANKLKLGDSLTLILEGRRATFTVVGTAQSPEFIYAMRTAQDLYPDPATFGISYVPLSSLKTLVKESGQVNDIVFSLEPGASFDSVKDQLQTELKPFGLQSIIPRKDQTSHAILMGELTSLKGTTKALPTVFLGVATIILYTMLRRLIEQQRVLIGTMKAFGLTNREIILHYLSYPLFIGTLGGLLGGLSGIALSFPLTAVYEEYFALPGLKSTFSIKYLLFGMALSLSFSLISGIKGSLDILRLDPAEAMRPAAPGSAHKTRIEQITFLWNKFSSQAQMGMRNVFRSPARSLFTVIGMAVVFSLMTVSWSMKNMTDLLTTFQFEQVQTYDVKIALSHPASSRTIENTLAHEPGISKIEPLLEIPASLKNQWLKKEVVIMGLPQDATLYNVLDQGGKKVPVPKNGILLSERLANLLQVKTGDSILIESPLARESISKEDQFLTVEGVIPQYVGLNAFMDIESLQKFLKQGEISTSVLLEMNQQEVSPLKSKYRDASEVASIESMQESTAKIREMIESSSFTIYFLAVLAGIAGFALIYNSSIISLSERQRELASLRVLGMTPREVLHVITSEQWTLCLLGVLLGIPLSFGLLKVMAQSMSSDLYSIPTQLPVSALLGAIGGTAFSVWIAQTRAHRKIQRLPFVEILATKE